MIEGWLTAGLVVAVTWVVSNHVWMLTLSTMPPDMIKPHAFSHILAGGFIAYVVYQLFIRGDVMLGLWGY